MMCQCFDSINQFYFKVSFEEKLSCVHQDWLRSLTLLNSRMSLDWVCYYCFRGFQYSRPGIYLGCWDDRYFCFLVLLCRIGQQGYLKNWYVLLRHFLCEERHPRTDTTWKRWGWWAKIAIELSFCYNFYYATIELKQFNLN